MRSADSQDAVSGQSGRIRAIVGFWYVVQLRTGSVSVQSTTSVRELANVRGLSTVHGLAKDVARQPTRAVFTM
eukprot:5338561-Pyramimonas_sp.AAC.1